MKCSLLLIAQLFLLSIVNPSFAQTCTSSGGDDIDDLDLPPYRFRCGTAMMHDRMNKVSKDYKLIEGCDNYWADGNYFRNKGKIYYSKEYGSFELIASAHSKSFRCDDGTARDDHNIYFKGKVVANIDKASFKSVGNVYCSDQNNVYYRNRYADSDGLQKVAGAKSSSFQLIGEINSSYAKDGIAVYYNGNKIISSDPTSFKVLEYGYAHDKNNVYYNGEKVEGMNGATFEILKDCFLGSDGVQLCNGAKVLENSDAQSFHAIECGYYKDDNNVYLNGSILEEIDSKSFQILTWGYTKDKDAVYCDLKRIEGADPTTFEVLARKHSRDSNQVFYLHHTMDCDYDSFELDETKDYLSKDKNGSFKRGIRIK